MVVEFPSSFTNNTDISHSVAVYRKFLMDNKMELLHNVNESIKSTDEAQARAEEEAWQQFELLNVEAPAVKNDDAVATYRHEKITQIAGYLNEVTENLYMKKTKLLQTRALLCKTIENITEDLQ